MVNTLVRHGLIGILIVNMTAAGEFELGIIVEHPAEQLHTRHWQTISSLGATAEILLIPQPVADEANTNFSAFEAHLAMFSTQGIPVAVTLTPHFPDLPWRVEVDEDGKAWQERHNLFDPDFRARWRRYHQDFVATYGQDERIRRVYVAPPSYFGEIEYYMGSDWSNLKIVAYGELGKAAFIDWLQKRYASLEALNQAWKTGYSVWDELVIPRPIRTVENNDVVGYHLGVPWLDFMQWRRDYLIEAIADELEVLGTDTTWEVSLKYSHGDTSMTQGTDSAAIVSRLTHLPHLSLHMTNAHSLSDLRYTMNHAQLYGVDRVLTENDGNRYTRSELIKITLTGLLSGIDTYNFSSYRHLLNTGYQATEVPQSLRDLTRILSEFHGVTFAPRSGKNDIAFFHSNSSTWARPPHYTNHDVSRVYDAALSNGPGPEVRSFDWARYLYNPDVIGEQHICDGDLSGRRLLVVPNSGLTLFPHDVYASILDWVKQGGNLVVFGVDGFAWHYHASPETDHTDSVVHSSEVPIGVLDVASGNVRAVEEAQNIDWLCPVDSSSIPTLQTEALPTNWETILEDEKKNPALLRYMLGDGQIYLYASPVPRHGELRFDDFFRFVVPMQLQHLAQSLGCDFTYEIQPVNKDILRTPQLNIGYIGRHHETKDALYVAGAYTGDPGAITLSFTAPHDETRGMLLIVDTPGIRITSDDPSMKVLRNDIPPYRLYQDPTNLERDESSLIPLTQVHFSLKHQLTLEFAE